MISILRNFVKSIPTLILSFTLAVAVWISAVNASDPIQKEVYQRPITVEIENQDPSLVISGNVQDQVTVTISAPKSTWERINNDRSPLRATVDLKGVGAGTHTLPINVQVLVQPAKIVSQAPLTVSITLEKLLTQEFPVHLVTRGEPAVGFQADTPTLTPDKVTISGPASRVEKIKDVRVTLDLTQASDNMNRKVNVQALDSSDTEITGLTVTPPVISVVQPISQRGGYRNVVIKVAYTGQVASGYRLTNVSVLPAIVTVFSSDPSLVANLPGSVETSPLDLTGVKDDIETRLSLNLPNGVEVVGDQTVLVQVAVAAIEGSVTLSGLPVQVIGLPPDLNARISPDTVDVIISGPVPLLDRLTEGDVRVFLDLTGVAAGTYQFAPKVTLGITELKLESILPSSIEVVVDSKVKGTLTPTPTPTVTPTPTPLR